MSVFKRRTLLESLLLSAAFVLLFARISGAPAQGIPATSDFRVWVARPELRITPASLSQELPKAAQAEAFRNEVVSLQLAVRASTPLEPFAAMCTEAPATKARPLPCAWVEIRYPGYLLVDEVGELLSDPLFEAPPRRLEANWTQPVWVTVHIPQAAAPGTYNAKVVVKAGEHQAEILLELDVLDFALPTLAEGDFYLNIWQDPAAVARWAKVPVWSEPHWKLLESYARDLAAHGQKSVTATILHDPWRSVTGNVYPSMVEWRFPGEWRLGQESKFEFDYSAFDRYVELMMKVGIKKSIHCFSLVNGPGDTPDCDIGYVDTQTHQLRIRHTTVGDDSYRKAWAAFLPAFVRHLRDRGWLAQTYIGFDEKPQPLLNTILGVLRLHAPDLKIALAGGTSSQQSADADDLTIFWDDLAQRDVVSNLLAARRNVGPTLFYTCCGPASPNTFLYSPLWESRLLPWIAWNHGLNGYLRWAYQSWPDGLWQQPHFRFHSGDMFLVYPGENGPLSSTRWEMLRQGIQDFEVLQELKARLAELKKQPSRSSQAEQLEKSMQQAVDSVIHHSCYAVPDPPEARRKINRLLLEATGKRQAQR